MLNPEGVIIGNFRCSLTGTDLNRRWDNPDELVHPQIFYLKNLLKKLSAEKREILVFCDLHGHSRKNNSFIYGCNKAANGGFCSWTKVRLLPRILAQKTPLFSYRDCKFRVEVDKQRTARVIVWKELGVTNSFTLESSFFGYNRGDQILAYSEEDYYSIGHSFLLSLLEYTILLKGIQQEMVITHGWLKPSKLIQLTGTPAADVLARKIAEKKEEVKRKARLSKIKKMLSIKKEKAMKFSKKRKKRDTKEKDQLTPKRIKNKPKIDKKDSQDKSFKGELPTIGKESPHQSRKRSAKDTSPPEDDTQRNNGNHLQTQNSKKKMFPNLVHEKKPHSYSIDENRPPSKKNSGSENKFSSSSHNSIRAHPHPENEEPILTESIRNKKQNSRNSTSHLSYTNNPEQQNTLDPGNTLSSEMSETELIMKSLMNNEWRHYFSEDEMELAYTQINKGIDPTDLEEANSECSESNPSADNLDKEEIQNIVMTIKGKTVEKKNKQNDAAQKALNKRKTSDNQRDKCFDRMMRDKRLSLSPLQEDNHHKFPNRWNPPNISNCPSIIITSQSNLYRQSINSLLKSAEDSNQPYNPQHNHHLSQMAYSNPTSSTFANAVKHLNTLQGASLAGGYSTGGAAIRTNKNWEDEKVYGMYYQHYNFNPNYAYNSSNSYGANYGASIAQNPHFMSVTSQNQPYHSNTIPSNSHNGSILQNQPAQSQNSNNSYHGNLNMSTGNAVQGSQINYQSNSTPNKKGKKPAINIKYRQSDREVNYSFDNSLGKKERSPMSIGNYSSAKRDTTLFEVNNSSTRPNNSPKKQSSVGQFYLKLVPSFYYKVQNSNSHPERTYSHQGSIKNIEGTSKQSDTLGANCGSITMDGQRSIPNSDSSPQPHRGNNFTFNPTSPNPDHDQRIGINMDSFHHSQSLSKPLSNIGTSNGSPVPSNKPSTSSGSPHINQNNHINNKSAIEYNDSGKQCLTSSINSSHNSPCYPLSASPEKTNTFSSENDTTTQVIKNSGMININIKNINIHANMGPAPPYESIYNSFERSFICENSIHSKKERSCQKQTSLNSNSTSNSVTQGPFNESMRGTNYRNHNSSLSVPRRHGDATERSERIIEEKFEKYSNSSPKNTHSFGPAGYSFQTQNPNNYQNTHLNNSVIGAIPRHDEKMAFQKLFTSSKSRFNQINQPGKNNNYETDVQNQFSNQASQANPQFSKHSSASTSNPLMSTNRIKKGQMHLPLGDIKDSRDLQEIRALHDSENIGLNISSINVKINNPQYSHNVGAEFDQSFMNRKSITGREQPNRSNMGGSAHSSHGPQNIQNPPNNPIKHHSGSIQNEKRNSALSGAAANSLNSQTQIKKRVAHSFGHSHYKSSEQPNFRNFEKVSFQPIDVEPFPKKYNYSFSNNPKHEVDPSCGKGCKTPSKISEEKKGGINNSTGNPYKNKIYYPKYPL